MFQASSSWIRGPPVLSRAWSAGGFSGGVRLNRCREPETGRGGGEGEEEEESALEGLGEG